MDKECRTYDPVYNGQKDVRRQTHHSEYHGSSRQKNDDNSSQESGHTNKTPEDYLKQILGVPVRPTQATVRSSSSASQNNYPPNQHYDAYQQDPDYIQEPDFQENYSFNEHQHDIYQQNENPDQCEEDIGDYGDILEDLDEMLEHDIVEESITRSAVIIPDTTTINAQDVDTVIPTKSPTVTKKQQNAKKAAIKIKA